MASNKITTEQCSGFPFLRHGNCLGTVYLGYDDVAIGKKSELNNFQREDPFDGFSESSHPSALTVYKRHAQNQQHDLL